MIAAPDLERDALVSAVINMVGQCRAFVLQVEGWQHEIGSLRNERAALVVEALGLTLREPAAPGTVRQLQQAATELLGVLRTEEVG